MKKRFMLLALMLVVVLAIAACGGGGSNDTQPAATQGAGAGQGQQAPAATQTDDSAPAGRANITIANQADIVSLDPHGTNDAPSSYVNRHIYSSLVRTTAQMEFVGDLAESWENLSPTEWQFNLRQGVVWHDGAPFTASDVAFSLMRQQEFPQVAHLVAFIEEVRVVDDYTVVVVTDNPIGPLLANLSHSATRIVPEHAVTYFGDAFSENPIGTGPLRFVSWTPGVEVVLERFEDYFRGPAAVETLTMRVITEGSARTIALETGEVDLILNIEPVDINRVMNHSDLVLYEAMSNRIEWLSFNLNRPPFDNRLVREAVAYAICRDSLNIVGYEGRAQIASSFTGPTVFGFNPNIQAFTHDPDRARALLAEAGFPDGFSATLWTSGDVRNRKSQVIQSNLREVGINVDIEILEWAAYLDRTAQGEHYMHLLGWTNLTGDADPGMFPLYHTVSQGAGNRAFFSNARVDELLDMGRAETNMSLRPPLYHEVQEILRYYVPVAPLNILPVELAARNGLQGVYLHPSGMHRFENLHF